jgi:hypothetical protein
MAGFRCPSGGTTPRQASRANETVEPVEVDVELPVAPFVRYSQVTVRGRREMRSSLRLMRDLLRTIEP